MKGVKKAALALILCIAVCASVPAGISASANSAMLHWRGSYAAGAAVLDEDCPVQVENELLTFNINEFPQEYYGGTEEDNNKFLEYGGSVTARYAFYNPADYNVNMTLAFPFGSYPDYFYSYEKFDDTAKYLVTADGGKVETKLRHTFARGDFDTQTDVGRLVDGFKEDEFYKVDLPVYIYRFNISEITYKGDYSVHVVLPIKDIDGRKILTASNGFEYDGTCTVSWSVRNGDDIALYSVGKPMEEDEFNFRFFYYGRLNIKKTVAGNADRNPAKDEVITFKQLALTFRGKDSVVTEADWYNAVIDSLVTDEEYKRCLSYYCLDLRGSLMRWYEYSLSIPAGGRLVNEVTAPIYPGINGYYTPNIYEYEYLLSPAQSWAAFGSLEVRINTPFYVTDCSLKDLEKTDDGYIYRTVGLPDGEFKFELCANEHSEHTGNGCNGYVLVFIGIPLAIFFLIELLTAGIVFLILFIIKKSKAKRQ